MRWAGLLLLAACLGGGVADGGADGPAVDAGGDAGDGGAVGDAGAGDAEAAATIRCGTAVCDRGAGQICCRASETCVAECSGEIPFVCDGPEDCGGNPCCAIVAEVPLGSSCADGSECSFGARLCQRSAECLFGQRCCSAAWVAGYCTDSPAPQETCSE